MRTVREARGMVREHAGVDVVAAEEVARVIEDDFVVVVVVVEERHLERLRVGLERPRHERADDEARRQERRVRRRRQVIAMTHQRTDVAHVESHRRELAVPADRIERVERDR